jgi:hypothetical protein
MEQRELKLGVVLDPNFPRTWKTSTWDVTELGVDRQWIKVFTTRTER